MEKPQFQQAITIGLGRAVLWLQEHPWKPHTEAIENICLHNTAYDPQVEGSRAEYAHEIVGLTDDQPHFADLAISGLLQSHDHWDTCHLYHLVRLFARDGDGRARETLYQKFVQDDAEEHFVGAEEIVNLDGLEGLLFVLDRIGQYSQAHPDYWVDDWLLIQAEEQLGEPFKVAISDAAKTKANIRKYIEAVERYRSNARQRRVSEYRRWTYPELREKILAAHGDLARGWLFAWGKHAPDDALREAAADLLKEKDDKLLIAYLRIFNLRPFPLGHVPLVGLASSENAEVVTAACKALRHFQDASVRALALQLIGQRRVDDDVVLLLVKNYMAGDQALLEPLLDQEVSENDFHWTAHCIVKVFKANADADALPSMLKIYEKVCCSQCRLEAVKVLVQRRNIPAWMLAECRHDSNPDVRKLVAESAEGDSNSN